MMFNPIDRCISVVLGHIIGVMEVAQVEQTKVVGSVAREKVNQIMVVG